MQTTGNVYWSSALPTSLIVIKQQIDSYILTDSMVKIP